MSVDEKSNVYLIMWKHPKWDSWACDIRYTDNGTIDNLRAKSGWLGPDCKIAICKISGQEILDRSIYIVRNSLKEPSPIQIDRLLAQGTPHSIIVSP